MTLSGERKAFIVVDLGFGDAGKGLVTDYLVRRHGADLVARFNGGAQAGHNVVTADGRHHTFSQFGSGSFVPGVKTHLCRDVVVHPTALGVEAQVLSAKGEPNVLQRLSVSPLCRVTTPFQQAQGRLLELARGAARHGSCGVGVGETVADSLAHPELTVCFRDLLSPNHDVLERLAAQRELKLSHWKQRALSAEQHAEFALLADAGVVERWLAAARAVALQVALVDDADALKGAGSVVFEGAQGVLLDEDFGFHPFTTYSHCTPHRARALLTESNFGGSTECVGVVRTYAVRHGPGPLPTESAEVARLTSELHNLHGPWQGAVRKGYFDLALLRYALAAAASVDALCVTHLDALPLLDEHQWCERYHDFELRLPSNLSEQEALTQELLAARPHYAHVGPERRVTADAFCSQLTAQTSVPVRYAASGRTANDVAQPNFTSPVCSTP
ncbi:MAG: adenylosuccinate synthetase [Polyangiaceae bacterium]